MSTHDQYEVEVDDGEKSLYKLNIDANKGSHRQSFSSRWEKHGGKIILAIGLILIAAISFEAGFLEGQKNKKGTIEINQAACAPCPKAEEIAGASSDNSSQQKNPSKAEIQPATENQKCAYVASKNSNKYHLATCQWATRIKPENKICFSSKEEAESRGYEGAKCCVNK